MKGGYEVEHKNNNKESPLCCINGHPPHPNTRTSWRMFARTISSVDTSTSTSRGTFARAISSVENKQIGEARNKGRKVGIGTIINVKGWRLISRKNCKNEFKIIAQCKYHH